MREVVVYAAGAVERVPSWGYWALLVVFCIGAAWLLWRKGVRAGLRASAVLLLMEWVLLVLAIAVVCRQSGVGHRVSLVPLSSYFAIAENSYFREAAAINILNVVMFVPVGLLLGCGFRGMTWRRVLCVAVVLSVGIEVLQLLLRRGLCETDDVLHNVVGTVMGYGIARLLFLAHRGQGCNR